MDISLIWAMAENGVIGRDDGLPWRLPADLRFFMRTTLGKPVIMGRRTFETLPEPLPGRTNIVLTRRADYTPDGAIVVTSFAQALKTARAQAVADRVDEIMIAGGAEIYRMGLAIATRLYVTRVHATVEGDTVFPPLDWDRFEAIEEIHHPADDRHEHAFTMTTYRRIR